LLRKVARLDADAHHRDVLQKKVLTKLAELETHVHHEDALLRKVARLDADAHHRDVLLKKVKKEEKLTSKEVMHLKTAEKKREALLPTKLARLSVEVHSDKTVEENAEKENKARTKELARLEKEEKLTSKHVMHLKTAEKREALLATKLARVGKEDKARTKELARLEKEEKLTLKQVMHLKKEVMHLKRAEKREALLSTKLERLNLEFHTEKAVEENAEKEDKARMKVMMHLQGAQSKEKALLMRKLRRLNAHDRFRMKRLRAVLKKLVKKEIKTMKQVVRLRGQDSRAWVASVVRRDLNKTKVWRWFHDVAREEGPLRKAIKRLTSGISKARSNAHVHGGSSTSEFKSSERALSQLKNDMEELTLHRLPRSLRNDMRVAKIAMTFLQAAAHPHVWHHGYIYATMDFADPSGDDDGGPPTNGNQQKFLSLPKGWQLAPATEDSRKVSINFGWSTDCLTFSNGASWQTNDGSDNSSCGKQTLRSNKKKQYKPAPDDDHTRRILMRFPVPK